jgi:EAL domain-containing protein (putative c-di-GMP-specific phosphodiesterase class I)
MLLRQKNPAGTSQDQGLTIAFQPIVSATAKGVFLYGYEALARNADGICPPLLSGARASEKAYALSFRCQHLALAMAQALGLQTNLSINVTPGSICHRRYGIGKMMAFAREVGFPLNRLILEITEREYIADYAPIRRAVDEFRADGLRVSMDDFGSGFNGLSTLLELQPDIVKVDMKLIQRIETDQSRQALMYGICSGGERLGMRLIAEGVETLDGVETLSRGNIDLMQGYIFAYPEIGVLTQVDPLRQEQVLRVLRRENGLVTEMGDMTGAEMSLGTLG